MMILKKIAIGAVCVGAVGCGGAPDAPENATTDDIGSVKEASIHLPDNFYKISNGPQIYWLHNSNLLCWVRDMGMLAAIQNVPNGQYDAVSLTRTWDNFTYGRTYEGSCRFPDNQMYKAKDTTWVYRTWLDPQNGSRGYCHVVDMNQAWRFGGQILTINQLSNYVDYSEGGARPYSGECPG